jgi:hypothetical protein
MKESNSLRDHLNSHAYEDSRVVRGGFEFNQDFVNKLKNANLGCKHSIDVLRPKKFNMKSFASPHAWSNNSENNQEKKVPRIPAVPTFRIPGVLGPVSVSHSNFNPVALVQARSNPAINNERVITDEKFDSQKYYIGFESDNLDNSSIDRQPCHSKQHSKSTATDGNSTPVKLKSPPSPNINIAHSLRKKTVSMHMSISQSAELTALSHEMQIASLKASLEAARKEEKTLTQTLFIVDSLASGSATALAYTELLRGAVKTLSEKKGGLEAEVESADLSVHTQDCSVALVSKTQAKLEQRKKELIAKKKYADRIKAEIDSLNLNLKTLRSKAQENANEVSLRCSESLRALDREASIRAAGELMKFQGIKLSLQDREIDELFDRVQHLYSCVTSSNNKI